MSVPVFNAVGPIVPLSWYTIASHWATLFHASNYILATQRDRIYNPPIDDKDVIVSTGFEEVA